MGFFSVNIEVFPIGISLRVRIRGTRSDGKLNLIIITLLGVTIVPIEPLRLFKGNTFRTEYIKRLRTIY